MVERAAELGHPRLLLSHLMFTGIYPALPTMAFFLVGMWLATLNLRGDPRLHD